MRRAATVSLRGSQATLSASVTSGAKCSSSSGSCTGAASWMRASRSPASSAATTMYSERASAAGPANTAPRPPLNT